MKLQENISMVFMYWECKDKEPNQDNNSMDSFIGMVDNVNYNLY